MIDHYIDKAKTLLEALPYIQKFSGKIIVIKYGGSAMEDESLKKSVATDIVLLKFVGIHPVIVHGGGLEINDWLGKLDIESKFIDGQRVTSPQAMDVIEMVLAGRVNKSIVHLINQAGGEAIGLSGKDGRLIQARQHQNSKLGLVGDITKVNGDMIKHLISDGYIPVISTIGSNDAGETFNINADIAATEIAIAIQAEKLIAMSNVEGILDKDKQIIKQVTKKEIEDKINSGVITGGMIPKVESAIKALHLGVRSAHIISGTIEHSILLEVFTDFGIGTMIRSS